MKNIKFPLTILLFIFLVRLQAQELNCEVIIDAERVQTQEQGIIQQMQQDISKFINTQQWTTDNYQEHERIKCTIFINLNGSSDVSQGRYQATVQIQSLRPVHSTQYETPLINFFDKNFSFNYQPSQPLIYAENVFTNNLTAMLAFYAYTILAMDADSFEKMGGASHYEKILNIVNNARQSGGSGWGDGDTRNRHWISENMNSPQFIPFREVFYEYHRLILDDFLTDTDAKRKKLVELLEKIRKVQELRPTAVMLNMFFDAKSNELINIFSEGNSEIQQKAVDILVKLDPLNSSKYRKIVR